MQPCSHRFTIAAMCCDKQRGPRLNVPALITLLPTGSRDYRSHPCGTQTVVVLHPIPHCSQLTELSIQYIPAKLSSAICCALLPSAASPCNSIWGLLWSS